MFKQNSIIRRHFTQFIPLLIAQFAHALSFDIFLQLFKYFKSVFINGNFNTLLLSPSYVFHLINRSETVDHLLFEKNLIDIPHIQTYT